MSATSWKRIVLFFSLILTGSWCPQAAARSVELPISIDYGLLQTLAIENSFQGPNQTAVVHDEAKGCRRIIASEPRFSQKNGKIRFEVKIAVRFGARLGSCLSPIRWEGYLVLFQKPVLRNHWFLSFKTVGSSLLDQNRHPARLASIVWNYVHKKAYAYMDRFSISLAPPVSEIQAVLSPLFAPSYHHIAEAMVTSLRPGSIVVAPEALKISVLADLPDAQAGAGEKEATKADLPQIVADWETWDAYLVQIIDILSDKGLGIQDRQVLLDTLLEARYGFVKALDEDTLDSDFVRKQFVAAWQQLSPLFRKHLGQRPSPSLIGYLAFFAASDALVTLDRIGPAFGIQISREGFIRLAQLIEQGNALDLEYNPDLDPLLQKALGLPPPLIVSPPEMPGETPDSENPPLDENEVDHSRPFHSLMQWVTPAAWAAGGPVPRDIRRWLVPETHLSRFVARVRTVILEAATGVLIKSSMPQGLGDVYGRLAQATSWQESCFRQFWLENGVAKYTVSNNGTSVGLMQINERVWRGLYNKQKLRWDIGYNAAAGCQILDLFITRYGLPNLKRNAPQVTAQSEVFAQAVYAMYTGGPAQFDKFFARYRSHRLSAVDHLISEKLTWVNSGQWWQLSECLGVNWD
jgi:hypothetical protein